MNLCVTPCLEHEAIAGKSCSVVVCAYPEISGCSYDRAYAIDCVKGAVLHSIGDWKKVPDGIEFRVRDGKAAER